MAVCTCSAAAVVRAWKLAKLARACDYGAELGQQGASEKP